MGGDRFLVDYSETVEDLAVRATKQLASAEGEVRMRAIEGIFRCLELSPPAGVENLPVQRPPW